MLIFNRCFTLILKYACVLLCWACPGRKWLFCFSTDFIFLYFYNVVSLCSYLIHCKHFPVLHFAAEIRISHVLNGPFICNMQFLIYTPTPAPCPCSDITDLTPLPHLHGSFSSSTLLSYTYTHTHRNIWLSYIFVSFLEIHNGCSLITNHLFLSSFNLALLDKHHPFRWRVRPLRERPISSSTVQPDAGDLSDPRRSAGHPNGFISR